MNKNLTTLTTDSQKLLIETVKQLEKIISTNESGSEKGASNREGPLFFPGGIGYISITVKPQGQGEVTFTVSGQYATKQVGITPTDK
ncbi:MAG: hypothetical protein AABY61_01595 [Nitrospirota bacterium]